MSETFYKQLLEKNQEAEAKYREKISYLEDRVSELQKEEK